MIHRNKCKHSDW